MEVVLTRLRDFSCKTSTFDDGKLAGQSAWRDPRVQNDHLREGCTAGREGTKLDIESALAWLRRELMEMRSQDQALIRQLMELHSGIQELKQELSEEEEEEESEQEGSYWDSESEQGSSSFYSSSREMVQLRDIINTAQNLVLMLNNSLPANARLDRQGSTGEAAVGQGVQSVSTRPQQAVQQRAQLSGHGQSVKQEMARSFPGFFQKEARGKRRFAPYRPKECGKSFLVIFFLLEKQYEKTPKGEDELPLMLAGLGKRSLTISENMTHSEISDLLVNAYPRLANICGGWMLHKSTGGSGRRKLVVIPPDLHGYTGQQLKAVTGNGKYLLYISPLQEELDTIPLPPEAKEFENMPKAQCTSCQKMVPLQILPVHIKECKRELVDLCHSAEEQSCEEHEDEFTDSKCNQSDQTAECPVCNNAFQVGIIEVHAATCGLRPSENDSDESSGSGAVGKISTFQRPLQQRHASVATAEEDIAKV